MKFCCAVLTTLLAASSGASIKWTGIVNDQQWTTPNNWYPAQVPGPDDDVIINDAENNDAVVITTTNITVKSVSLGNLESKKARLRVLAPFSTSKIIISNNGFLEIDSGIAVVNCPVVNCAGEWDFFAGTFVGNATITGFANFGTSAAKIFENSTILIRSAVPVVASGSLQFKVSSSITSSSGIRSMGNDFQCLVQDTSTGNYFNAGGFTWKQ